ncbi:unnamed protein product [Calypogeia fissa]
MDLATFGGLVNLSRSILAAAESILDLGDGWFHVTEKYKSNVDVLKHKIDFFGQEMGRHGVPVNSRMMKTLREAEQLLKDEEDRVTWLYENINGGRCCGVAWWLYAKVTMVAFPNKLERTIKRVSAEIDKIVADLKMEAEVADYFKKLGEGKAISTTVQDNDQLYVPIQHTQDEVIAAIEDYTAAHSRSVNLSNEQELRGMWEAAQGFKGLDHSDEEVLRKLCEIARTGCLLT